MDPKIPSTSLRCHLYITSGYCKCRILMSNMSKQKLGLDICPVTRHQFFWMIFYCFLIARLRDIWPLKRAKQILQQGQEPQNPRGIHGIPIQLAALRHGMVKPRNHSRMWKRKPNPKYPAMASPTTIAPHKNDSNLQGSRSLGFGRLRPVSLEGVMNYEWIPNPCFLEDLLTVTWSSSSDPRTIGIATSKIAFNLPWKKLE